MKYKKILFLFLVFYFVLLVSTPTTSVSHDEGAQAMDSIFYYNLFKDLSKNPSLIFELKNYAVNFYAQYPALYVVYHPPLYNLITAGLYFLFGVNFLTTKLLSMLFSVATLYVVYLLGSELYSKKVGFFSAFVTGFATYFLFFSKLAMLDVPLVFFTVLSIYLFHKALKGNERYFYYLGISLGVGFLIRYHIVVTGLALFFYLFYRRKFKENKNDVLKSIGIFSLISLPFWIVLLFYKGSIAVMHYLQGGGLGRCNMFCPATNIFTHLYYYPLVLFFQVFPLILLVPLFYFMWKRKANREDVLLLFIVLFYLLATMITSIKEPKYILPVIPLISVLFVRTSFNLGKYGKYILAFGLIGEILMCIFMPTPLVPEDRWEVNSNLAAKYVNERIAKNANVFLHSNIPTSNGFVFHFAKLNDFRNGIIRGRPCYYGSMGIEEYQNHLDKYNVQFFLRDDDPLPTRMKSILKENFEKVAERGEFQIFKRKEITHIKPPNRICNENCKLKRNFCTVIKEGASPL